MRKKRHSILYLFFLLALLLLFVHGCGGEDSGEVPGPWQAPSLEERLESAKAFLSEAKGDAARASFLSILEDHPGSSQAHFGLVLADELRFMRIVDELITLIMDPLVPSGKSRPVDVPAGKASHPIDVGAIIVDYAENLLEPMAGEMLDHLEFCRGDPLFGFSLKRLPLEFLGIEFLVYAGEYDAGDVLMQSAEFSLIAAALDTIQSADLGFDFQIVLDHIEKWEGLPVLDIVVDVVDMMLEMLKDREFPNFLRLREDGFWRMPRAGLEMGYAYEFLTRGVDALRSEVQDEAHDVTGCGDRNGNGVCDSEEYIHGVFYSFPSDFDQELQKVDQALRDSYWDGTELDTAPGVSTPFTLEKLNPVLKYLGLPPLLPCPPIDFGDLYANPNPDGIRKPLRTILIVLRCLLGLFSSDSDLGHEGLAQMSGEVDGTDMLALQRVMEDWVAGMTRGKGGRSLAALGREAVQEPLIRNEELMLEDAAFLVEGVPQGPPAVGLDTVTDVAALPYLRPRAQTLQQSSHDPTGGNEDGYLPPNHLYVDDHGEFVLFDQFGPGCIYRMWFTHTWSLIGNLRIYVDDMECPVIEGPVWMLFLGALEPFTEPVVGNWLSGSGGCFCYLPIPFEKRCKITYNVPPEYYNITYVRYDTDTPLTSFTGEEDDSLLRSQWRHLGQDPKPEVPAFTESGSSAMGPGDAVEMVHVSDAGAIWRLFLHVEPFTQEAIEDLWLLAFWDRDERPAVEAPVSEFFGSHIIDDTPKTLLMGRDGEQYYSYFPMPFWQEAAIALENRGSASVQASWEAMIAEESYAPTAGTFKAVFREENPVPVGRDYRIGLREDRRGKWIGLTHTMRGPRSRWYLEGDERFYVNGSLSPALYGTGTEDYYNGGWYFLTGLFTEPLFGNPSHHGYPEYDLTGTYRLHVGDAVQYLSGVRLGIEHGGSNEGEMEHYSSVAYYYEGAASELRLTDSMDVGDPASEAAHDYLALDEELTGRITSSYEGEDDSISLSDTGRVIQRESSFRVLLAPENEGVLLRRRYDQFHCCQQAKVFVDGVEVGTWYSPEASHTHRWAESDLFLPPSRTSGLNAVEIRIRSEGMNNWTEFFYWVYSLVP